MIFGKSGVSVYIMTSPQHPGKYKIGISNKPKYRAKNVSKSMPGSAKVFFQMEMWFAYHVEQMLHKVFDPINAKKMKGSGKTEWFKPRLPMWLIFVFVGVVCWYKPASVPINDFLPIAGLGAVLLYIAVELVFVLFVVACLVSIRLIQEIGIGFCLYWVITELFREFATGRPQLKAKVIFEIFCPDCWQLHLQSLPL